MSVISTVVNFITRKNRKGKNEKVYYIEGEDGKRKYIFNPSQRGEKYAHELHTKEDAFTKNKLSNTQLAYRSGYLKSRSDNSRAYNYNKNKRAEARAAKAKK